ncbi:MAG: class I SAM-dependent methyltransferase [Isosphaeraceae bacterium]
MTHSLPVPQPSPTESANATFIGVRGPVVYGRSGRPRPNPNRPASYLSQRLLLDALNVALASAVGDVLDVGCGEKPYQPLLGDKVTRCVGCDWPSAAAGGNQADVHADAARLPFADSTFDTVLCTELLEHVPLPVVSVKELGRVLRPGGRLILSAPFLYWRHEAPRDHQRFTPDGLRDLAVRAGLEPLDLLVRGDAFSVIIDLWSKTAHSWMKQVRRRFGYLGAVAIPAGWLLVDLPQRAYLGARAISHRCGFDDGRFSRGLGMSGQIAQGYVLVAKKSEDRRAASPREARSS